MSATDSRKKASKSWRKQNLEAVRAYNRNYYQNNKATMSKQNATYRENERITNPKARMIRNAKCRANQMQIDFNITQEDIEIPTICPVLGIELRISNKKGGDDNSPSIDRIDNGRGYIKGNVRVISNRANKLKNNANVKELELVLEDLRKTTNDIHS